METYQIFTDATADMCDEMLQDFPSVRVIPMRVEIGDKEYTYGENGTITAKQFYDLQRNGKFAVTSQINPSVYFQYFEPVLEQGKDIIYLCFSSGMSGCLQSAHISVNELKEKYPERKIFCIDTRCASVGEGFLVREALKKQAEGLSLEELEMWLRTYRLNVCHWFTVDVFEHLQHGGRVSAAAATVGTVLQIKPLLHVDTDGKLAVMEKARGRKRAIRAQLTRMEKGWMPELSKLVVIGHGDDPDGAKQLQKSVIEHFPEAEIYIVDIGPVIGAHTGPGMLALIYWGNTR